MISSEVVIITRSELKGAEDAAFKRGVERGKFEAASNAEFDKVIETAAQRIDLILVADVAVNETSPAHCVANALLFAAKTVREMKSVRGIYVTAPPSWPAVGSRVRLTKVPSVECLGVPRITFLKVGESALVESHGALSGRIYANFENRNPRVTIWLSPDQYEIIPKETL